MDAEALNKTLLQRPQTIGSRLIYPLFPSRHASIDIISDMHIMSLLYSSTVSTTSSDWFYPAPERVKDEALSGARSIARSLTNKPQSGTLPLEVGWLESVLRSIAIKLPWHLESWTPEVSKASKASMYHIHKASYYVVISDAFVYHSRKSCDVFRFMLALHSINEVSVMSPYKLSCRYLMRV